MKPSCLFALAVAALLLTSLSAGADGGVVQIQKEIGDYHLTLFSEPSPLCAGPADLSVLLQKNGVAVLDASITLKLEYDQKSSDAQKWEPLCCRMDGGSANIGIQATHGQAANKLLYSALVPLPYPGRWKATVIAKDRETRVEATGTFFVLRPQAPGVAYLPYLLVPIIGVGFFGLVQMAKRDRSRKDRAIP